MQKRDLIGFDYKPLVVREKMFAGLMGLDCHSKSLLHRCEVTEGKKHNWFSLTLHWFFSHESNNNQWDRDAAQEACF